MQFLMCIIIIIIILLLMYSSIVGNDIAYHTLRVISMPSHLSSNGCSNLCSIGRIEVIANTALPIAIEGNCSCNSVREAVASDTFTDVSVTSSHSRSSGPNFLRRSCIEMIANSRPPVAIERYGSCNLSCVEKTLSSFRYISMMTCYTSSCCPNFMDICRVEMVAYTWLPIAIEGS